jgi:SWI/SNF-related matrix-associated actin-dependent regulator of chromatin subfamily A3
VGINLTAANFVYMLDPWWNPATEDQAMDRVHRLGQDRPVTVVRFVCKDTIDEKMMELQQRKRELAKAAFVKKTEKERQEMRKADLSLLLSLTSLV